MILDYDIAILEGPPARADYFTFFLINKYCVFKDCRYKFHGEGVDGPSFRSFVLSFEPDTSELPE